MQRASIEFHQVEKEWKNVFFGPQLKLGSLRIVEDNPSY